MTSPCSANFPAASRLETSYVGRLGRHLLQSLDLAEPVDYVDPEGGGDYYAAGTQLSQGRGREWRESGHYDAMGNPIGSLDKCPPFRTSKMSFRSWRTCDYTGESATQSIYDNEWAPYRAQYGATTALADIDFYDLLYGFYAVPANWQPHFWQNQFSSLYALDTIGMSYYNAGQLTLRHPTSHGLQMDVSYTFSQSIDLGSDAERNTEFTGQSDFQPHS